MGSASAADQREVTAGIDEHVFRRVTFRLDGARGQQAQAEADRRGIDISQLAEEAMGEHLLRLRLEREHGEVATESLLLQPTEDQVQAAEAALSRLREGLRLRPRVLTDAQERRVMSAAMAVVALNADPDRMRVIEAARERDQAAGKVCRCTGHAHDGEQGSEAPCARCACPTASLGAYGSR